MGRILRDGITDFTQCYRVLGLSEGRAGFDRRQTDKETLQSAENVLSQELLSGLSMTRDYRILLTHTTSMTCLITLKLLDL